MCPFRNGTVSDVDADLEEVDAKRSRLEAQREDAARRLQRLRCARARTLFAKR